MFKWSNDVLVGGLEHLLFFHILGFIIPTYFSKGLKPPTSVKYVDLP
jgi:hypothetical protein